MLPQHPKSLAGPMPCGCVMEWIWMPGWSWGRQWQRDPWGQEQAAWQSYHPHPALDTPGTIPSHRAPAPRWLQGRVWPQAFPWKGRKAECGRESLWENAAISYFSPSRFSTAELKAQF